MTEKIRVNVSAMSLGDMAEAREAAGDPQSPGFDFRQIAAMAWVIRRRDDPSFTYEDALALRMGDIEIAEESPEASGGVTGATPPLSLASGTSIPGT